MVPMEQRHVPDPNHEHFAIGGWYMGYSEHTGEGSEHKDHQFLAQYYSSCTPRLHILILMQTFAPPPLK